MLRDLFSVSLHEWMQGNIPFGDSVVGRVTQKFDTFWEVLTALKAKEMLIKTNKKQTTRFIPIYVLMK